MTFENRENLVEGILSQEAKSRLNREKHLIEKHKANPLATLFGAATALAVAKRINPEAAKNLELF